MVRVAQENKPEEQLKEFQTTEFWKEYLLSDSRFALLKHHDLNNTPGKEVISLVMVRTADDGILTASFVFPGNSQAVVFTGLPVDKIYDIMPMPYHELALTNPPTSQRTESVIDTKMGPKMVLEPWEDYFSRYVVPFVCAPGQGIESLWALNKGGHL
jgi:hypothetical protein